MRFIKEAKMKEIISGFLKVFFDIHGPFKIFNGLIIWFQREGEPGLTGLFNNRNYASLWFTILWPICLAILSQRKNGSKLFIYIFSFFNVVNCISND